MDEPRYSYGYNQGWNVRNEYIESLQNIFEDYNKQLQVLKDIETRRKIDEAGIKRNERLTDEEIKKTYDEFYADSNISFEQYKKNVEKDSLDTADNYNKVQSERYKDEYEANVYYMIRIKEVATRNLNQEKRNLETKLRENTLNFQKNPIGKEADELFLDIQKIRHAISEINTKLEEMKLTKEETDLALKGLNPRSKEIFESIINRKGNPIENEEERKDEIIEELQPEEETKEEEKKEEIVAEKEELEKEEPEKKTSDVDYDIYISKLTAEELEEELAKLESELRDEWNFRAHYQNGMEENEDADIDLLNEEIKAIENEKERRKKLAEEKEKEKEVEKPQPQPEEEEIEKKLGEEEKPEPPVEDPEEEEPEKNKEIEVETKLPVKVNYINRSKFSKIGKIVLIAMAAVVAIGLPFIGAGLGVGLASGFGMAIAGSGLSTGMGVALGIAGGAAGATLLSKAIPYAMQKRSPREIAALEDVEINRYVTGMISDIRKQIEDNSKDIAKIIQAKKKCENRIAMLEKELDQRSNERSMNPQKALEKNAMESALNALNKELKDINVLLSNLKTVEEAKEVIKETEEKVETVENEFEKEEQKKSEEEKEDEVFTVEPKEEYEELEEELEEERGRHR